MINRIQFKDFSMLELSETERMWASALHLSILLNFAFPLLGILTPIGIWYHHREQFPFVHSQARELLNLAIFNIAFSICFFTLSIPLVYFLPWLTFPFALVGLVYFPLFLLPFWAAYNVYQGADFKYPLPFRIFK